MRAICILAMALLASCGNPSTGNANDPAGSSRVTKTSAAGSDAGWNVAESVDAMTDVRVYNASNDITGSNFDVKAKITCGGDRVGYTFDVFDKADQPAPMLVNHSRILTELRIDKEPAMKLFQIPTAVPNQLYLFSLATEIPSASALTVRLNMASGQETLVLDQTNASLKPMLDKCISIIDATTGRKRIAREKSAAELKARCGDDPCPIPMDNVISMDTPAPSGRPITMSEGDLARVAECQDQAEGRGTEGAQLDCKAILARNEQYEEQIARRDFELEAEENR